MTVVEFVNEISSVDLPNVFNPYRDICHVADDANSPAIRQKNLFSYLQAMRARDTGMLWLGRDLGYRGGRRTGIALTDEFHLGVLGETYGLRVAKATVGVEVKKERTATEVWKLLVAIRRPVFLWNVFPFHPFESGKPFTNRRHTAREFNLCSDILVELVALLRPTKIIVLGADAETGAARVGLTAERVRHPSYGGHVEFRREIRRISDAVADCATAAA